MQPTTMGTWSWSQHDLHIPGKSHYFIPLRWYLFRRHFLGIKSINRSLKIWQAFEAALWRTSRRCWNHHPRFLHFGGERSRHGFHPRFLPSANVAGPPTCFRKTRYRFRKDKISHGWRWLFRQVMETWYGKFNALSRRYPNLNMF